MTPDQIIAFVLALTAPAPAEPLIPVIAAGGADPQYPVVAVPCPSPLAPMEVDGHTVTCGRVSVPENHDKPDGRKIELGFMILRSHSLSPAPDPVVYLHGGPGSGVVRDPVLISRFLNDIRDRRDIVAFDQRGVDTSAGSDSRCYATIADPDRLAAAASADPGTADMVALGRAAVRACLEEIAAKGADLSTINTRQNARDVQALMRALGHDSYNIFGTSYGTKLGQEVMRSAPEGLRAVILDSVAPLQKPLYDLMGLPLAENIRSLFTRCAADAACAAAYPDLEARFWSLWAKLEAAPLPSAQGPISGRSIVMLVIGRNNFGSQGITAYMPKMISELERGETTTYTDIAAKRIGQPITAAAVLASLTPRDPDMRAFAEAALRLAEMGEISAKAVDTALTRLEAARNRTENGAGLADEFDAALGDAARALPSPPARLAFGSDYLLLRASDRSAGAFKAMLARHFGEAVLAGLLALADRMTADQIVQVFDRIGADNGAVDELLVGQFQLQMFACQEDMEINGPATISAASAQLRQEFGWPEPMIAELESGMITGFYEPCEDFTRLPPSGFNDPVTSAIPTLVLQGTLDTQTAPSWGADMVATLPNGQLVELPESGHGTFIFSDCSRSIAAAFLDRPEARIDMTCAADLTPVFVLPDGTRSR